MTTPNSQASHLRRIRGSLIGAFVLLAFDAFYGTFISAGVCPIWFLVSLVKAIKKRPGWVIGLSWIVIPVLYAGYRRRQCRHTVKDHQRQRGANHRGMRAIPRSHGEVSGPVGRTRAEVFELYPSGQVRLDVQRLPVQESGRKPPTSVGREPTFWHKDL